MTIKTDIFQAFEAGIKAMTACFDKASKIQPDFKTIAENAILSHLRAHGEVSGEALTAVAKSSGAVPHSDKAFGSVFKSLSARGLIKKVGYAPRSRGHGAPGPVWAIGIAV